MDTLLAALYLICTFGGLVMIAGGLALLFKRKIVVDKESNDIIEYELPVLGRLKTNSPAIGVVVLGLAGLGLPLWFHSKGLEETKKREKDIRLAEIELQRASAQLVTLSGKVESTPAPGAPVHVYAVMDQADLESGKGEFHLDVPLAGHYYDVLYMASDGNGLSVVDQESVPVSDKTREVELHRVELPNLPKPVRYKASGP